MTTTHRTTHRPPPTLDDVIRDAQDEEDLTAAGVSISWNGGGSGSWWATIDHAIRRAEDVADLREMGWSVAWA